MIQKVKVLGTALVVSVALSVVMASAASAANHHFNGTKGDSITTEILSPLKFEHTTDEGKGNECNQVNVEAEVEGATQTSLTVAPIFTECEVFGQSGPMTFNSTGCHFKFAGVTTSGNPTGGEHANIHLECEEGKSIETRITALKLKCSTIGTQLLEHAVSYENQTTGETTHVTALMEAHGVENITQGACGEGTHTNGSFIAELAIRAPNGISISTT